MRTPALALLGLVLISTAPAQRPEGVYRPKDGSGVPWQINDHQALIWNGSPYLPIGVRVDGSPEAIKATRTSGIGDVVVDLPAGGNGWSESISALEAANLRYLVRVSSLAPMAKGVGVDPSGYRISGVVGSRHLSVSLPGATGCFVIIAQTRDGSIQQSGRAKVTDGRLEYDVKAPADMETVALIYPETASLEQPDLWEGLDEHRDTLLTSLRRHPFGKGLRGIVNPIGKTITLPGRDLRFVPTGAAFRLEFRNLLEDRYKSLETVARAWSMSGSAITNYSGDPSKKTPMGRFEDLARLVPLWSGSRGVPQLWDPQTDILYPCDSRRSAIWKDIAEAVSLASVRRIRRLVAAIRQVDDVPVVQEWSGWSDFYEVPQPAVDGIGMRTSGTQPSALLESGSRATSSLLRWKKSGWLTATDVAPGSADGIAKSVPDVINDVLALGARGCFIQSDDPAVIKAVAGEATRHQADTSAVEGTTSAVYFPENATNPAVAQRLAGGRWWLPAPMDGNRVEFGANFYAYRMFDPAGEKLAIWAKVPGRYLLRMGKPAGTLLESIDGTDPLPKIQKNGIELTLTQFPLIVSGTDEVPVPDLALKNVLLRFAELQRYSETNRRDMTEDRIAFQNALSGFERNPGGAFFKIQQVVQKATARLGDFVWLEAETTRSHNFSEVLAAPGCSGGSTLSLRSALNLGGYFASFDVPVKSSAEQEVWVAAKIPVGRRADVSILIGGQTMTIQSEPVSQYGAGYAWYKFGTTRLGGGVSKLRFAVANGGVDEIGLDAILITPHPFRPDGVTQPDLTTP